MFIARCFNYAGACFNSTGAKNTLHVGSCNFTGGYYINHLGGKSFLLATCKFQLAYFFILGACCSENGLNIGFNIY